MQDWSHDFQSVHGVHGFRGSHDAERPVVGVISGAVARVAGHAEAFAQELPDLGQVGADVARAARIAAARHRVLLSSPTGARGRPTGFLEPNETERKALFADLASDEGVLLPEAGPRTGFLWRLHPAPCGAGAPVASARTDAR